MLCSFYNKYRNKIGIPEQVWYMGLVSSCLFRARLFSEKYHIYTVKRNEHIVINIF